MPKEVDASEINLQEVPDVPLEGKEEIVDTQWGRVSVFVEGDPEGVPCITCCAVGTDWQLCFDDLLLTANDDSVIDALQFYHIDYAGYKVHDGSRVQDSAADESDDGSTRAPDPAPTQEEMVGKIHAVVQKMQIEDALGIGVGFGGHVLVSYAAQHPKVFMGLVCIGLPAKPPRWQENNWGRFILQRNRWAGTMHQMSSRLFSQDQLQAWAAGDMDLANWYHRQLVRMPCRRVMAHLQASLQRTDLSPILMDPPCRILLISGTDCHYHEDVEQLQPLLDHKRVAVQKVDHCGLLCSVEDPEQVLPSIELFLQGLEAERNIPSSVTAMPLSCVVVT